MHCGDKVPVLYPADDPAEAVVYATWSLSVWTFFFAFMTALWFITYLPMPFRRKGAD